MSVRTEKVVVARATTAEERAIAHQRQDFMFNALKNEMARHSYRVQQLQQDMRTQLGILHGVVEEEVDAHISLKLGDAHTVQLWHDGKVVKERPATDLDRQLSILRGAE